MSDDNFNYLFVSDLHVGPGYDSLSQVYHPREDFHYEDSFFRFLKWADSNRRDGKPWELVFVGDCFDFLPIEIGSLSGSRTHFVTLAKALTSNSEVSAVRAWEGFLHTDPIAQSPLWFRRQLLRHYLQERLVVPQLRKVVQGSQPMGDSRDGRVFSEKISMHDRAYFLDDASYEFEFQWSRSNIKHSHFDRHALELEGVTPVPWWAIDICWLVRPPTPSFEEDPSEHQFVLKLDFMDRGWVDRWYRRMNLLAGRTRGGKWNELEAKIGNTARKEFGGVQKLYTVYKGHQSFFQALAWWVAVGHKVVLLRGNHDLEICWGEVQTEFKKLLWRDYLNMMLDRLLQAYDETLLKVRGGSDSDVAVLIDEARIYALTGRRGVSPEEDPLYVEVLNEAASLVHDDVVANVEGPAESNSQGNPFEEALRKAYAKLILVAEETIYKRAWEPSEADTFEGILEDAEKASYQMPSRIQDPPPRLEESNGDSAPSLRPQDAKMSIYMALLWLADKEPQRSMSSSNQEANLEGSEVEASEAREGGVVERNVWSSIGELPLLDTRLTYRNFRERIDFEHPWFYYKRGVFYAEHGAQYDNFNASSDLLHPYLPSSGNEEGKSVNLPFGSLGVTHIVAPLEDRFPDWENFGTHSTALLRMLNQHPYMVLRTALTNGRRLIKDWKELYIATRADKGPLREKLEEYANRFRLPFNVVDEIHKSWDKPLLMHRRVSRGMIFMVEIFWRLAWIIDSSLRLIKWLRSTSVGLVLLAALAFATLILWRELIRLWLPVSARLQALSTHPVIVLLGALIGAPLSLLVMKRAIQFGFHRLGAYLKRRAKKNNQKLFHPFLYPHTYLFEAATDIHEIIGRHDPKAAPRFYVMGHDHRPAIRRIPTNQLGGDPVYYYNTGSWLASSIDEGLRLVRTRGLNVEFPFLKISDEQAPGKYLAHLMLWNDFSGSPEGLIVLSNPEG